MLCFREHEGDWSRGPAEVPGGVRKGPEGPLQGGHAADQAPYHTAHREGKGENRLFQKPQVTKDI